LAESSITIKKQTGDTRGLAFAIYARGKVLSTTGNYNEAEKDYLETITIHKEMGERLGLGMVYNKLGSLYVKMDRLKDAKETVKVGLDLSDKFNIVIIKFKCEYLLYSIYRLENNQAKALESLEKYLDQKEAVINTQTLKVIENYELINKMKDLEKEAQVQKEKAEIIAEKNRAEEAVRVRQEFLSGMSHEIRTPLNAIVTITSMMHEKAGSEERQMLNSLKYASNNLFRIVNDILYFTRLDAGTSSLETRLIKIKPFLENIAGTFEEEARKKGLKLALKMDVHLAENYEIDEIKLSQMLGNIISNAVKFTDKGKVDIEVEKLEGTIDSDKLRFKISDTGEGIPNEFIDKVFDSFSHTKPVMTRKHGGTGLGLAIVKGLVELHEGHIGVSSELGKGSEFYFDIGLKKQVEKAEKNVPVSTPLQGKTVLVAEDNELNAMVVRKLLTKWGMVSELARNGSEAIDKAKQKVYDFILMDIHMPEVNGFDATKFIRSEENMNTNTPVFALTADLTASMQKDYVQYFNGFLWKPLQIEKLFDALNSAA